MSSPSSEAMSATDAQQNVRLDQLMSTEILAVGPDSLVSQVASAMGARHVGAALVLDKAQALLGLFTERDLLGRVVGAGRDPVSTPVAEVMTRDVLVLEKSTLLSEAFRVVTERGFRHIPLSAGGTIVGMVSLRDLFRVQLREVEVQLDQEVQSLQEARHLLDLSAEDRAKELLRINERLRDMALTDELTGLHNYRYFAQRAEAEVSRATRHSLPLSRLVVDSDRFTLVTGTHGHPVGDQVLKAVAELRREGVEGDSVIIRIRRSDVIARYGGEEFAVLLPMTRTDGALVTGERVRSTVASTPVRLGDGREIRITVSVGVSTCPEHGVTAKALIRAADDALYRAKQMGRNRVAAAG